MNPFRRLTLLPGLLLAVMAMAQSSDLASPQKRAAVVAEAAKLLQPRAMAVLPANLASPFAPPGFDQPDPAETKVQQAAPGAAVGPVGNREVLEDLSARIAPSGIARFDGESILLFGQKKLKVGDQLTITFEGVDYNLEIAAIGSTTFTLRYKGEEITRSIKPGNKP
jgi:hypothetical protein